MESNKINIIFTGTEIDEEVQINDSASFNELILKFFGKMENKPEDVNNKVFFEVNGKKHEWNSKTPIKKLSLKNDSKIKVKDDNNLLKPKITRSKKRKLNIDDNNKMQEFKSNISVLADMALLGFKIKDDIDCDENGNLIKYEDVLDKECDEHIFTLGLIGKYLDNVLGIHSRIDEEYESQDTEEKENAINSLRYISNGFITKYKYNISIITEKAREINQSGSKANKIIEEIRKRFKGEYSKLNDNNFAFTINKESNDFLGIFIPFIYDDVELNKDSLGNIFKGEFSNKEPKLCKNLPIIDTVILSLEIFKRTMMSKKIVNLVKEKKEVKKIIYLH